MTQKAIMFRHTPEKVPDNLRPKDMRLSFPLGNCIWSTLKPVFIPIGFIFEAHVHRLGMHNLSMYELDKHAGSIQRLKLDFTVPVRIFVISLTTSRFLILYLCSIKLIIEQRAGDDEINTGLERPCNIILTVFS